MRILAVETSCDETAVSVLEINKKNFCILSNVVSSQVKIHAKWGGVVPTLAKREHQANLIPVLKKALLKSNLLISNLPASPAKRGEQFPTSKQIPNSKLQTLNKILEREEILLKKVLLFLKKYEAPKIDAIAITHGLGLEPALWVGINFAKALAFAWNKPIIPVNHMEGHLFSVFLQEKQKKEFSISNFQFPKIKFPAIALLVSGGHTELILVKGFLKYKMLGQTRDDAAGEAFDKAAKMLGLGYPGGPAIAKLASRWNSEFINSNFEIDSKFKIQNSKLDLPRPMISSKDFDFSFSGLKTSLLYKLKEFPKITEEIKIAASAEFQQAVIDVLIAKTLRAAKEYKAKTIILGGGVAANNELREQFSFQLKASSLKLKFLLPEKIFTGDNAAMIAFTAYLHRKKAIKPTLEKILKIQANGNLRITK